MSETQYKVPDKPRSGTFGPMTEKTKVQLKIGVVFTIIGTLLGVAGTISVVSFALGGERSNALNRIENIAKDVSTLLARSDSQEGRLRTLEQTYSVGQQNTQRLDAIEKRMYEEDKATSHKLTEIGERLARIEVAVGATATKKGATQ